MKIDPYYQQQKCRPMTLVSGGIRFIRIFAEIPWGGPSNDSVVLDNGNFQRCRWLFLGPPGRAVMFCCCFFVFFFSARSPRSLGRSPRTLPLGPKYGVLPSKKIGTEKHTFWRDFGRLRTSIANISGMEQVIDNRKTALQTTISPASADFVCELWSTNGEK